MFDSAKDAVFATFIGVFVGFVSCFVKADGIAIDKVYHPYVEPLEWELEWRMTHEDENPISGEKRAQTHRLGLGKAIAETVFAEIYLIGAQSADSSLALKAYEFEILWQLSEQGEFFMDYGLLFELEREKNNDIWEYSTVLLLEKEFGQFSGTANIGITYEWGEDIENEWESSVALQARFRHSPRLEPAIELYVGEDTLGLGPVVMGMERVGHLKALRWEAGAIFGIDSDTPDYTLRAVLEYEF